MNIGPYKKRLIARCAARIAVPSGGGLQSAMHTIVTPGRMAEIFAEAAALADNMITTMRSTPDNPFGDDEEVIAAAILKEAEKR